MVLKCYAVTAVRSLGVKNIRLCLSIKIYTKYYYCDNSDQVALHCC